MDVLRGQEANLESSKVFYGGNMSHLTVFPSPGTAGNLADKIEQKYKTPGNQLGKQGHLHEAKNNHRNT